jgi:hypothetical protein
MKEILLNVSFGGFGLSQFGLQQLAVEGVPIAAFDQFHDGCNPERRVIYELADGTLDAPYFNTHRNDSALLRVAKEYPHMASTPNCRFGIAVIPPDVEYTIIEREGMEYVAEAHRRWFPRILSKEEN